MTRFAALFALFLTACSDPLQPGDPVDYLLGDEYVMRHEAMQFCARLGGEIATTADDLTVIQALLAEEPIHSPNPGTQSVAWGWLGDSRETENGTVYTLVRYVGTFDARDPTTQALPVCRVPR